MTPYHKIRVPMTSSDTPTPCANGCGFFGSRLTDNLCSKCYREAPRAATEHLDTPPAAVAKIAPVDEPATPHQANTSRCWTCNKKIGLTGITCRCGYTFCPSHRHADQHACTFDFKGEGRALLTKTNPVVAASKLDQI